MMLIYLALLTAMLLQNKNLYCSVTHNGRQGIGMFSVN